MKMDVTALTLLILRINMMIDSGKYSEISISNIHDAIEGKRVLRFLKERAGDDINLRIHLDNTYGDFETYYEDCLERIYGAYAGDERRRWGVQNSGLCLLLAWTSEIVMRGDNLEWQN